MDLTTEYGRNQVAAEITRYIVYIIEIYVSHYFSNYFIGELTKVRMEHDNSGFRPGWFLEKVEILNQATSATSVFPCQRWLDKDKDDGQIVRDILVSC